MPDTVPPAPAPVEPSKNQRLYDRAFACLGADLVQDPAVPDELQCASQVNAVYRSVFKKDIGGGASTMLMGEILESDPRFKRTTTPTPGSIIISPTGSSKYGAPHGHVGIVGKFHIISNNSLTGKLDDYYTLETWTAYYGKKKGFPVRFYDLV